MKTKSNVNKKRLLLVFLASILCVSNIVYAQNYTLRGNVKDVNNEPLIGVNVVEKGTSTGSVTDINGNFSFSVSEGATIVFSYIGYESQEITLNGEPNIVVTLIEDSEMLEEVVITALGIQRSARALSYATQGVDTESMTEAKSSNFVQSLSGKISGVITNLYL